MNWFIRFINKLFLVKQIDSKLGEKHFQRYRLIQTPWFAVYIHHICKSDMEKDAHDHPWNFSSILLEGAYQEKSWCAPNFDDEATYNTYYSGDVVKHKATDAHKLTLISDSVWTLVFTSGRERIWGYQTSAGWIDHLTYRQLKNEGKLR